MNDRRLIEDYLPPDALNSCTLSEESREELDRIMSWLDEACEDI